jgi:hypothetical protein
VDETFTENPHQRAIRTPGIHSKNDGEVMALTQQVEWKEFKTNEAQRNQINRKFWDSPNSHLDFADFRADDV